MPADLTPDPHAQSTVADSGQADDYFDEVTYLRAFPDVLDAVERGQFQSGRDHYQTAGRHEGRLGKPEYQRLRGGMDRPQAALMAPHAAVIPQASIDILSVSPSGAMLVVGWADDRADPLSGIGTLCGEAVYSAWNRFPRLPRPDVARALDGAADHLYGFWLFAAARDRRGDALGECQVEFHFRSGANLSLHRPVQRVGERGLCDAALAKLASMVTPDMPPAVALHGLDERIALALADTGRDLSRAVSAAAVVEPIGPRRRRYRGSIITLLDSANPHLALQAGLFASGSGIEDYEFITVVNQPELLQSVYRDARVAAAIYGLPHTVILQPADVGPGTAWNAAAAVAHSDRLLFIGPDVFPRDLAWARHHTDLLSASADDHSRLFGATLYDEDGSLRHAGLYLERDLALAATTATVTRQTGLRIETYGRGAPSWATQFARSRPVPAVSHAFLSINRSWFEKLGGFTELYHSGQYEDADLCLRSLREGVVPWLHPIAMWQLDAGAATAPREHVGGDLLNQFLFRHRWDSFVSPDVLGKQPSHPLLLGRAVAAASEAEARGNGKQHRSTVTRHSERPVRPSAA